MTQIISKVDDKTINVEETKTEVTTSTYDYDFLKQQLLDIQKQRDEFNALRDAEIIKVKGLLAEADKLGVGKPLAK